MVAVSSWGRLSAHEHKVVALSDPQRVSACLALPTEQTGLAFGMGRSYGDVCLNPGGTLWSTNGLANYLGFDETSGRLRCESGVLLRDIQRLFIPRGWSLAVTPGTQFVTVGGAIANDIHGKNHHQYGTFGEHVCGLTLTRTDGSVLSLTPGTDLFRATVGGLGLTGVITSAELQLKRCAGPWLTTETHAFRNLSEFFSLSDASVRDWEHTVAWIDCLHKAGERGLFMRANTVARSVTAAARKPTSPRRMPFPPPFSVVNRLSLPILNTLYFQLNSRRNSQKLAHYEPFFYPLDALQNWNRLYGKRGFYQYQSVVPSETGADAVAAMMREIKRAGEGSFLAVLKTFGERRAPGMLSFPHAGVTLALDFPNRGGSTLRLFARLDAIVSEAGGRLYPAKDARMPRELFERGYPHLTEFLRFRDPGISSAMSRRLLGS
jgi:FAD/FMN-containing dehydrogenase